MESLLNKNEKARRKARHSNIQQQINYTEPASHSGVSTGTTTELATNHSLACEGMAASSWRQTFVAAMLTASPSQNFLMCCPVGEWPRSTKAHGCWDTFRLAAISGADISSYRMPRVSLALKPLKWMELIPAQFNSRKAPGANELLASIVLPVPLGPNEYHK